MHQSLQRDLLLVREAGHPLERLLEAYIVAQLDVITVWILLLEKLSPLMEENAPLRVMLGVEDEGLAIVITLNLKIYSHLTQALL